MDSGSYHGHGHRDRMYELPPYSKSDAGRRNANNCSYDSRASCSTCHGQSYCTSASFRSYHGYSNCTSA